MFIMYELLSVLMYAVRNCIINTKQTYFKEVVIHILHTFKHTQENINIKLTYTDA